MYIRNVQMTKDSEVTQAIQKANPYMVLDTLCRTPLSAHNSIFVPAFTQCC